MGHSDINEDVPKEKVILFVIHLLNDRWLSTKDNK